MWFAVMVVVLVAAASAGGPDDLMFWPIVTALGLVLTWLAWVVRFVIQIRSAAEDEKKRRRDDDSRLGEVITRVCKEFTNSNEFMTRLDRHTVEIAQSVVTEAFRERSDSFVDSKMDTRRESDLNRRLDMMETTIEEIRTDFQRAAGTIAGQITTELKTYLQNLPAR